MLKTEYIHNYKRLNMRMGRVSMDNEKMRCAWVESDDRMLKYHDEVWGVPEHEDQKLFAKLSLELMQAGLSWKIILDKQENFEKAFDNFHIETVANYDEIKFSELLQDVGIVRNKLKINAIVNNANRVLEVQKECRSFNTYLWSFTKGKVIKNDLETINGASISDTISKDLKNRGFKFVSPTIVYAWLQAVGVINGHLISCFLYQRYEEFN